MILVTGSTGLVGSHLIYKLLQTGHEVRALKRGTSDVSQIKKVFGYYTDSPDSLFEKLAWAEGDITDKASVFDAMEGVDEVYHTAAYVSFNPADKKKVLEYNIEGTTNLVDAAMEKQVKKFCFASSTAALGEPDENNRVDETSAWVSAKGKSIYSISKYKSEMEVWRGIHEGLQAVIVNPSIIIGPGNWKRSSSKMFNEIWKGMRFYTHGVTGYVDVNDVADIMVRLMDSNLFGEKFILSEGNYSYKEIFDKIADALGKKRPSVFATPALTKIAYVADKTVSLLTGKTPVITKETIVAAQNKVYFSNKKIIQQLQFTFKPIDLSINETAGYFINDKKAN